MLLDGVNHVAILTKDTDALHAFYRDVFDAVIGDDVPAGPGMRLSFVHIGPSTTWASRPCRSRRSTPSVTGSSSVGRPTASSPTSARSSCFFVGPDGLEGEVCVTNPNAEPGVMNRPGTKAEGYDVVTT